MHNNTIHTPLSQRGTPTQARYIQTHGRTVQTRTVRASSQSVVQFTVNTCAGMTRTRMSTHTAHSLVYTTLCTVCVCNARVGRVTGRLPKELADEVVGSVLELCRPMESDGAWHGGKEGALMCVSVLCVCVCVFVCVCVCAVCVCVCVCAVCVCACVCVCVCVCVLCAFRTSESAVILYNVCSARACVAVCYCVLLSCFPPSLPSPC